MVISCAKNYAVANEELNEYLTSNFILTDTLDFENNNIVFNMVHPQPKHLVNCVILAAKQYMYRSRCFRKELNIQAFIHEIPQMYKYELYYAKQTSKLSKHISKWYPDNQNQLYNSNNVDTNGAYTYGYINNK